MSLIVKPFKVTIKAPELTKRKMKEAAVRVLEDIASQYGRMVRTWSSLFCPKKHGDLSSDLAESAQHYYTIKNDLEVGVVLLLESKMPYSQIVNDLNPPIDWTNPISVYEFFNALVNDISLEIPKMERAAIKREFP